MDVAAHRQLTTILSPFLSKTLNQENLFFDTPRNTLSSQLSVLRLRLLNKDARCIVSLKSKPTLVDGVSRVEEDEEELDPCVARACVKDPMSCLSKSEFEELCNLWMSCGVITTQAIVEKQGRSSSMQFFFFLPRNEILRPYIIGNGYDYYYSFHRQRSRVHSTKDAKSSTLCNHKQPESSRTTKSSSPRSK
ncbi:hypothetical protein V6N13_039064 [Hibiscus sabdariffa]